MWGIVFVVNRTTACPIGNWLVNICSSHYQSVSFLSDWYCKWITPSLTVTNRTVICLIGIGALRIRDESDDMVSDWLREGACGRLFHYESVGFLSDR